ncbi:hypothetical protein AgCh_039334 [Apium graveolens]
MARFILVLALVVTAAMPAFSGSANASPEDVEKWFGKLGTYKEKVTKLHFYYHDLRDKTALLIAQANSSATSPTFFGMTYLMDDPLTAGPQFTSKPVGRAQGLYTASSTEELSLLCVMNFVFTDGMYNGSTLSISGYNPILREYRELPIIGGTGVFRLARGVAQLRTFFFEPVVGNVTIEYNVLVQHY